MRNQKKYPIKPEDKSGGIMAAIVFVISLVTGAFISKDPNVVGACAILCGISLTTAMVYAFKDFEKNGGHDDEQP